jgi:hypothetical protein
MKTKGPKQDSQNCLIIINNNYIILATVNFDNEYTRFLVHPGSDCDLLGPLG